MMGSSNFQLFNPTLSNQETDAEYASDTLRSGGIQTDDILPSPFLNKVWYQPVTGVWSLMQMMANKGFTVSDANPTTLATVLANILTTADIKLPGQNVSYTSSLNFDCGAYNGFYCVLSGSVTSLTLSGGTLFQIVTIAFNQGGAGGFTVAWPSNVLSPGVPSPVAGKTSMQQFWLLPDGNFHPVGPMTVS
jgi:hypothetical protein